MLSEEKGEYQHPLRSNLTDLPKFTVPPKKNQEIIPLILIQE